MDGTININRGSADLRRAYVCIPDKPVTQKEANKKQTPVQNVKNVFLRNGNLISIGIRSGQHSSPNQARIYTISNQDNNSQNIEKINPMLALPTSNSQQHSNLVFVNINNQPTELKEQSIGTTGDTTNKENLESKSEKLIANITDNSWKVSMDQHPQSMIVEVRDQKEDSTFIDLTGDDDQPTELKKQSIQMATDKTNVINLGNKTKKAIAKLTDNSWKVSLDQHLHSTIVEVRDHIKDLTVINLTSDDDIIEETENTTSKNKRTEIPNEVLLTEEDLLCEKYYNDYRDIIEKNVISEVNIDYLLNDINVDEIVEALKECNTLQNRKEATAEFMNDSSTILSHSSTINLESSQSQMVTHKPNVNNPHKTTSADNLQRENQIINLIKYDEQTVSVASTHQAQNQVKHTFHMGENSTTDFSISNPELNNPLNCHESQVTKPIKSGLGTTIVENSQSYSINNANDKSRNNDNKTPVSGAQRSQLVKEKTNQNETLQSVNNFDSKDLLSSCAKITAFANLHSVKATKSLKTGEGATTTGASSQAKRALDSDKKIIIAPGSYSGNNPNDKSRNYGDKRPVFGGEGSQSVKEKTNEFFKTAVKVATITDNSQSVNDLKIKNPLSSRSKITAFENSNTVKVNKSLNITQSLVVPSLNSVKPFTAATRSYSVHDPRNQLTYREKEFTASTAHPVNNNNKVLENGQKCMDTAGSYSIRDKINQPVDCEKMRTAFDASSQSAIGIAAASTLKENTNKKNICVEKPEGIIANSQLINPINTDNKSMAAVASSASIILKKQFNSDGGSKGNNLNNGKPFKNSEKQIDAASRGDINLKLQSVSSDAPVLKLIKNVTYEDNAKPVPQSKGNKNSIIQHEADIYKKTLKTKNILKLDNLDGYSEKSNLTQQEKMVVSEINKDILISSRCSISNLTSHEPACNNKSYSEIKKNKIKPVKIEKMLKQENFKYKKSTIKSNFAALHSGPTHSFGAIINSNLALKNYVIPRIRKDLGINKLNNAVNAKMNETFQEKIKDAKVVPIPHDTPQNITSAKRNDTVVKTQSSQCKSTTTNINRHIQKDNEPKSTQCPIKRKLHNNGTEKCQFSLPNPETTINIEIYNMNVDQSCVTRNVEVNNAQSEEYCELSLITQEINKSNAHNKNTSLIRNKEKYDATKPSKISVDMKKRKLMVVLDKNEIKHKYMKQMKNHLDDSTGSEQLFFGSNEKICNDESRNNNVKTNTKKRSHRQSEVENKLFTKKKFTLTNIKTHSHTDAKQTKRLNTIEKESKIVRTLNVDCQWPTNNGKDISSNTTKDTTPPKLLSAGSKFRKINNPNCSSSNEMNELIKNKKAEIANDIIDYSMTAEKLCVKSNNSKGDNNNGASTGRIIEKEKSIRNKSIMFTVNTVNKSKILCNQGIEHTNVSNNESLIKGIEEDNSTIKKEVNIAAHTANETMTTIQGIKKKQLIGKQPDVIEARPFKEIKEFEKLCTSEEEPEGFVNEAMVGQESEKNTNKLVQANTTVTSTPINSCAVDNVSKKVCERDQSRKNQTDIPTKEIQKPEKQLNSDDGSKNFQYKASEIQEKIKNNNYIPNKDETEKGTLSMKLCISEILNETLAVQENEKGKSVAQEDGDIATDTVKHTTLPKNSDTLDNEPKIAYNVKSMLQAVEKDKFIKNNQATVKELCTTTNARKMFNGETSTTQEKDKSVTKQYYNNRDVTPPEDKPNKIVNELVTTPKHCEEQPKQISVLINKSMNSVKDLSAFKNMANQGENLANANDDESKDQVDINHTENKPIMSASLHSSLFKRYKIDTSAFLHKGEHSRIIKARSKKDNSTVAVKILPKMSLQSTHIEILRKLCDSDKNRLFSCIDIEEIYDAHRCWCISMTFYPQNLSRALEINGTRFNIDKVQELSRQLLAALILLRTNEIIHTDIKPSHILINAELTALKLAGFDKAMYRKRIVALPQMGTFNYHSPEVFLGISFSYPADIWSAACTMFEMATKQILFEGVFPYVVLENITSLKGAFSDRLLRKGIHRHRYFSKKAKYNVSPKSSVRIKLVDAYKSSLTNIDQIVKERKKILMFSELLDSMLDLDYNERKSIELAYIHPFIYK